ncbi:MAG: N-acetylmuramoyl-L-alanine amidase [Clostridia bacterium]|nr:N-acetylmuramoyl-L-alanine amidase [Clostridia bacterium]MBR3865823.1 N-acetylmuramoyl-L-alanine amidase [Clostridia bacterium]
MNKKILLIIGIILVVGIIVAAVIYFARSPEAPVLMDNYEPKTNIICIDAGHGGSDPGAVNGDRQEKIDTLALALRVASYIEKAGYTPLLTRSDDTYLSLGDRCAIANDADAAYFVSLHRNSAEGGKGTEVWISSQKTAPERHLAQEILKALDEVGVQANRGVKAGTQGSSDGDYAVNRNTKMPSCIIELGFIGNDEDNRLLDKHIDDYAKAIADAIVKLMEK